MALKLTVLCIVLVIASELVLTAANLPQDINIPAKQDKTCYNDAARTSAMFVPHRKDDFAWENDRIAFRMYGPALQNTPGEVSGSGVDVWVKSVKKPVIEAWYKRGDYHTDHGEGLDFYKVGSSRGCGGIAFVKDEKIYASKNFADWKIIASEPNHSVFELMYEPWNAGGVMVGETKRISIDLESNLSRFESLFKAELGSIEAMPAVGIVRVNKGGTFISDANEGWMTYWPPPDAKHGSIGCAVVMLAPGKVEFKELADHGFLTGNLPLGGKVIYYAGACWDRGGDFKTHIEWTNYVKQFAARVKKPR